MLKQKLTQLIPQWLRVSLSMLGIFFFLGAVLSGTTVTTFIANSLMIFGAGFLLLSGLLLMARHRKQKEEEAEKTATTVANSSQTLNLSLFDLKCKKPDAKSSGFFFATIMYEPQMKTTEDGMTAVQMVRLIAGIFLLFLGIAIALWLMFNIYNVLNSPDDIPFIAKIVPAEPADTIIGTDFGDIDLPYYMFVAGGYVVLFLFYSLFAGIANTLLRGGIGLLESDLKQVVQKLTTELKMRRYK